MRLPDRQRSRMVLIGTGRYADGKLPDLPVVRRTISDLAAALTDPVYGVVPENHCTVLEDQADIRLIGRALRSAAGRAEDLLLVYFVGHGLVAGRRHELYLGLPDSQWAEPEFNSLEYDKLRSAVLDSTAATKIIILDCCFSGRVVSEAMADPVTEMVGQIEVDGTYVLASAGRDQVALIQPGEDYTAFTGRFLHMLRNGVPGGPELLTVDYLYRQLVIRMKAEGLSQPQRRGTSTADLLALAANRAFAAAGQHLQQATDADIPSATRPLLDTAAVVEPPAAAVPRATPSAPPPAAMETTAGPQAKEPEPAGPDPNREVTVVPGVLRYHNAHCILIRFMSKDDLATMTLGAAKEAGCTPCRACLPDQPEQHGIHLVGGRRDHDLRPDPNDHDLRPDPNDHDLRPDPNDHDLRPDPLAATTPGELMECTRRFHIWAGNRGLRVMARHIKQQLSPQTLSNLLKSDQLPRLGEQMRLLIEACGGDVDDQRRFVTAWRRFMMG